MPRAHPRCRDQLLRVRQGLHRESHHPPYASPRVEVYLVPHTTGFSRWLARWQNQREVGVVAVACISNILAGGFEMRARSIASQCVLLDFPGCQKHWSGVRIPTAVNEEQLVNLLRAG
jgi:uncharacterized protein